MKENLVNRKNFAEYKLEPFQILRYEVSDPAILVLNSGKAEIFGRELCIAQELSLMPFDRGTLNTFHGCSITIFGDNVIAFDMKMSEDQYIPILYLNIHANFEVRRQKAQTNQVRGPRVLICGLDSVGKSTCCVNLVNYASRKGFRPMLIDLNPSLNQISIPTTISAISVSKPCEFKDKFVNEEEPLVFCLGRLEPAQNIQLFDSMVLRLAEMINIRCENDSKILSSGCFINMGGFKKNDSLSPLNNQKGIQLIKNTVQAFEVDTIIVIEDVFLVQLLKKDLSDDINIIRVPKSSGVVTRSPQQWNSQRDARIAGYFHGESKEHRIYPHKLVLSANEYEIYRLGSQKIADSLLPHGATEEEEEDPQWRKVSKVTMSRELKNRVLAVSQAEEPARIADSPIHGFIVVVDIILDKGEILILGPNKDQPPSNLLFLTELMYVDPEH